MKGRDDMETIETTEITTRPEQSAVMSLKQISDRVNLVHQVLEKVMKGPSKENPDGVHYGTVPGCGKKMVLFKPGADVLAMTFRLVPQFRVDRTDLADGHREYDVTCSMFGPEGALLGQGVGSASTMEKKYRYRKGPKGEKIENEDIADVYNTVLKIAKKRAHIDATLTVTGAADLFTQDLIDEDKVNIRPPVSMPVEETASSEHKPVRESTREPVNPDAYEVTGVLEAVSEKTTKKDSTRYGCKINGEWYDTFSDTLGADAKALKGAEVRASVAKNGKYLDLLAIEPMALDMDTQPDTQPETDADGAPF